MSSTPPTLLTNIRRQQGARNHGPARLPRIEFVSISWDIWARMEWMGVGMRQCCPRGQRIRTGSRDEAFLVTGHVVCFGGAGRGLRHDSRAGEGKGDKGIQEAVEK